MRKNLYNLYLIILICSSCFLVSYSSTNKESSNSLISFIAPDSKYQITHARLSYRSNKESCSEVVSTQISFLENSSITISLKKECFPYDFYLEYFCKKDTSYPCYAGIKENIPSTDQDSLYLSIPVKKQPGAPMEVKVTEKNSLPTNIGVAGEFETEPVKNILLSNLIKSSCMYCDHAHVRGLEVLACNCQNIISLYNDILDCHDVYITDAFEGNCHSLRDTRPSAEIAFLSWFEKDQEVRISKNEQIVMWDCRGNPSKKYCRIR